MSSLLKKARSATGGFSPSISRTPQRKSQRRQQPPRNNEDEEEAAGGGGSSSTLRVTADYRLQIDDDAEEAGGGGGGGKSNSGGGNTSNSVSSDPDEAHLVQRYAPCSTLFCIVQTAILAVMMWQCGIAPLNINPMIGPGPDVLNYWGAKNAVLIIDDGEFYRLFTPVFLHAGLIHLAGNVMVQMDAGNTWEKEWGSLVWMLVYVGSTLGSSVFSCCFMPDNISVGSSGAVMGLFGAKASEIFLLCFERGTTMKERAAAASRRHQACTVVGGIAIVMAMSFIPFVDWAAHLGGVIAGFVIGMVCFSFRFRSWVFVVIWFVAGVGSVVTLYSLLMVYMYTEVETKEELRDVCGYYQQFFEDYECNCSR
jgi:membrane associated rhomboid family serine protease